MKGCLAGLTPWTPAEDATLRTVYVAGGIVAAEQALPHRTRPAIYHRAKKLGCALRRRHWTKRDDERLELLWGDGNDLAHVARQLNRSRDTTYHRAQELGLPLGCPRGWEYLSHAAKRTGYAVATLRRILWWGGVKIRPGLARPTGQPMRGHIVDPVDVDVAVEAWLQTEPVEAAARRLGVCGETLKRRLRRIGVTSTGHKRTLRVTAAQLAAALSPIPRGRPDIEALAASLRHVAAPRPALVGNADRAGFSFEEVA